MDPLRIGVIGCGNISGIYFENLGRYKATSVIACADLDLDRAKSAAEKHGIPHALTPEALIAHPDVELVLNLTIPKAHGPVALQAVQAGKHVYNEKPLSASRAEAHAVLKEAKARNLFVGCAPDTFLGAGIQKCRQLIDEGAIGTPVAAQAAMLSRGVETWHPAPEFFYKPGGGPMLDMGPYYVTALVNLLGAVKRVAGFARISFEKRPIPATNTGYYGRPADETTKLDEIVVETSTHLAGVMDMAGGAVAELTTSFDVYGDWSHPITIYGSDGTLRVPDPNTFGGPVQLRKAGSSDWQEIELDHGFVNNSRGVGVLDIAYAVRKGGSARASGQLAYHVLDVMLSFQDSSDQGKFVTPDSEVERPAAMAPDQFADSL